MGALIDQVDEYYVRIRFDNALATAKTPIDITRIDVRSNSKSSILPNKSRLPSPIRTFKARRAPSPSTNTPCKTTTESRSICRFMICTSKGMRTGRSNYTPTTPATVIRSERTTRSNSIRRHRPPQRRLLHDLSGTPGRSDRFGANPAGGGRSNHQSRTAGTGRSARFLCQRKDAGRILSIAYAGKTYDNQGDNTKSTIHGATAKQKIALAFYEATNEMNGYYCGPFVDVQ